MKIKKEDYEHIKTTIGKKITKEGYSILKERVIASGKYKDLQKRLRWDCVAISKLAQFTCSLYSYLDDKHIDNALKNIMKDLKLEEN